MSKFGIEPLTPLMREASERLHERCMEVSKELAPIIDEACRGDQRKLWTVIGSAHWGIAFVALAMLHPNEDEFVRAMKSQSVLSLLLHVSWNEKRGCFSRDLSAHVAVRAIDHPRLRHGTPPDGMHPLIEFDSGRAGARSGARRDRGRRPTTKSQGAA